MELQKFCPAYLNSIYSSFFSPVMWDLVAGSFLRKFAVSNSLEERTIFVITPVDTGKVLWGYAWGVTHMFCTFSATAGIFLFIWMMLCFQTHWYECNRMTDLLMQCCEYWLCCGWDRTFCGNCSSLSCRDERTDTILEFACRLTELSTKTGKMVLS